MQKILIGELRDYQTEKNEYPGYIRFTLDSQTINDENTERKVGSTEAIFDRMPELIELPEVDMFRSLTTEYLRIIFPAPVGSFPDKQSITLSAIDDIGEHIDIFDGALPSDETIGTDDQGLPTYEAIISEEALALYELTYGNTYYVEDYLGTDNKFNLKIVGVFRIKEENSPFWSSVTVKAKKDIYIDYDLYVKDFIETRKLPYCKYLWSYYFDYNELKIQNLGRLLDAEEQIESTLNNFGYTATYKFPIRDITEGYFEKVGKISVIMLSINVPLLFMLALFILMISMIKINREKNEIAVAASRGAGRFQISAAYFAESVLMAFLAFLAGPFIGIVIARFIGATTGFMEFVNRAAIETPMVPDIFYYSLSGALATIILTTLPAFASSAVSIVTRKQSMGRFVKKPFWQRIYLDVVLFAASGYGIYMFNNRMKDIKENALKAAALEIDPLMFIIPALFMVAMGLLFLRLYPFFVEGLFKSGKRVWTPGIYASLLQTSRMITQYGFISLFIMFTIALGIFNANSARTIKTNAEDRIRYEIGGQVVINPVWDKVGLASASSTKLRYQYIVPDFNKYLKLECVDVLTKVYKTDQCKVQTRKKNLPAEMMAVTTDEFGAVSWLRNGLLDYHWYEYLNLIALEPSAILISRSLAEESELKPGDIVNIFWGEGDSGFASFIVYAIIDYWPSWNPNQKKVPVFKNGKQEFELSKDIPMLIVANYKFVTNKMESVEPWNVWLKLKPGADTADLYNGIEENGLNVKSLRNSIDELVNLRKDAFQMGLNGAMTVSFCTALLVCLTGFILFWVQSIKSRELQYGIFRAIGLKSGSVRSMLVLEQVLISGVSIFIGVVIGIVTTKVFMKFFNLAYDPYEQVPPFQIIMNSQDYVRLFIFIAVMLVIGLTVLSLQVSKIKPAQALKLGED